MANTSSTQERLSDLRNCAPEELKAKHEALQHELQQMRLRAKAIGVERPSRFRQIRRTIARILTIQREQPSR